MDCFELLSYANILINSNLCSFANQYLEDGFHEATFRAELKFFP